MRWRSAREADPVRLGFSQVVPPADAVAVDIASLSLAVERPEVVPRQLASFERPEHLRDAVLTAPSANRGRWDAGFRLLVNSVSAVCDISAARRSR